MSVSRRIFSGAGIVKGLTVAGILLLVPVDELRGVCFVRGNLTKSIRGINIADPIAILRSLFSGQEVSCKDAADVNDDGEIAIADAVYLLEYLFLAGPPPPPPFPHAGPDPTADALGCGGGNREDSRGIYFVIDRSGSGLPEELLIAKRVAIEILETLSEKDEFSVVFFDSLTMKYPPGGHPVEAAAAYKEIATSWIRAVQGGSGTCAQKGLMEAFNFAFSGCSDAAGKSIVFLSDGFTTCPGNAADAYANQTLAAVRERNQGRVPIRVIGVGTDLNPSFLEALAAQNNGTFEEVPR